MFEKRFSKFKTKLKKQETRKISENFKRRNEYFNQESAMDEPYGGSVINVLSNQLPKGIHIGQKGGNTENPTLDNTMIDSNDRVK